MWNLKKYNKLVNITKKSRLTDIENKLVATSRERRQGAETQGQGEKCYNENIWKYVYEMF